MKLITSLCVAVLSISPVQVQTQEVGARIWVDSTNFLIGDWITVHLDLTHPKGTNFTAVIGDTVNDFHVLRRLPFTRTSDTSTTSGFVVARYDSGRAILPPLMLAYVVPGDSTQRTVSTNPLLLTTHMVPVDTSQDIKDVKPPLSISITLAEILLYAGIVLLIAALGYVFYRWWKKRQTKPGEVVWKAPPRPAHVIAYEELGRLKDKRLWQQGLVKEYYSELTEILRRYIENRYGVMALEQTTDEILFALQAFRLPPAVVGDLESILRNADLVKFAKHKPAVSGHEVAMAQTYAIIEKTRVVEPSTVSAKEAVENVGA